MRLALFTVLAAIFLGIMAGVWSLQITHEEAVSRATGTNPSSVRQP